MADKFPEIDVPPETENLDGDFFSREQEILGDEFKTDQDAQVLHNQEIEDTEIQDFKENFPEVDETPGITGTVAPADEDDEFEAFEQYESKPQINGESQPLKEWRQRRDLEIEQREQAYSKKKAEITAAAQQGIDDFYDNYNAKRDKQATQVLEDEKEFLAKRDTFLTRGTLWDRAGELISEVGDISVGDRDKTRFQTLLTKLKGKENVPGAAGYTS